MYVMFVPHMRPEYFSLTERPSAQRCGRRVVTGQMTSEKKPQAGIQAGADIP